MSAPQSATRRQLKVVCPHDCPDTCVMTVDVEAGRAVAIGGDPDHRFTQGFLCAKVNQYLDRVYSPERVLHPMRRVGRQGRGPLRAHLVGRGARHRWRRACGEIAAAHGPQADPALLVRRQHGPARQRQHGPALLPRARGEPARPHDLRERRAATATRPPCGKTMGYDPEAVVHARLDRGLGRQHRQLERAPVAVRRGGAPARGAARLTIDPFRSRTAEKSDLHLAPLSRHGRRARARDDARRSSATGSRTATGSSATAVGHEELRERAREWTPERDGGDHRPAARRRSRRSRASTRPRGRRPSASTTGSTATPAAGWRCARSPACRRWSAPGATWAAARCSRPRAPSPWTRPPSSGPTSSPRDAHAQHEPARAHPRPTRRSTPPVKALFVYNSNPAAVAPEQDAVRRGLAREDLFVVVHEQFQTDTADFADILLPATTTLEHYDIHKAYGHLYVSLSRPAIAPARRGAAEHRALPPPRRAHGARPPVPARVGRGRWRGRPSSGTTRFMAGITLRAAGARGLGAPERARAVRAVRARAASRRPRASASSCRTKLARGGARPRGRLHPAARGARRARPSSRSATRSRSSRRPPTTS